MLTNEDALWDHPAVPHRLRVDLAHTATVGLMDPARAEGRLWHIDTGHDLMITEPDFVASALMEIAAKGDSACQSQLEERRMEPSAGRRRVVLLWRPVESGSQPGA